MPLGGIGAEKAAAAAGGEVRLGDAEDQGVGLAAEPGWKWGVGAAGRGGNEGVPGVVR